MRILRISSAEYGPQIVRSNSKLLYKTIDISSLNNSAVYTLEAISTGPTATVKWYLSNVSTITSSAKVCESIPTLTLEDGVCVWYSGRWIGKSPFLIVEMSSELYLGKIDIALTFKTDMSIEIAKRKDTTSTPIPDPTPSPIIPKPLVGTARVDITRLES